MDVINPLTALKVSAALLALSRISGSNLSKRKPRTAHESGSKKISRAPPRPMSSLPRTPSPSLSEHILKNVKNLRWIIQPPRFIVPTTLMFRRFGHYPQDHRSAAVPLPSAVQVSPIFPESSSVPGARSNPNLPSKSTQIVSPQPLRPLDRKPSSGGPRNRSPSSSTAFSDLAQHGMDIVTHCNKTPLIARRQGRNN